MRTASTTGPKPQALADRIRERVIVSEAGCWEWQRPTPNGYGKMWVGSRADGTRRYRWAHIVAYEEWRGLVPDGLELDHLCRNTACVNPTHLEAVTRTENVMRSENPAAQNARRTHCKRGHEFTEDNTYRNRGKRYCITCKRAAAAA